MSFDGYPECKATSRHGCVASVEFGVSGYGDVEVRSADSRTNGTAGLSDSEPSLAVSSVVGGGFQRRRGEEAGIKPISRSL